MAEGRPLESPDDKGLVVGRKLLSPTGDDKTTLLLSTSDTAEGAGVLHSLLQPLAAHGISMTRIESRPSRRKNWEYVFFIDVDGHREDPLVSEAIREMEESSVMVKILGSYPRAVL